MMHGLETVVLTKIEDVEELEVVELKMLRFSLGVTRKDRIKNEYIRSLETKLERQGRDSLDLCSEYAG